jgi:hypothetical protein
LGRGPSAATYSRGGLTFLIAANTNCVVSGRLKMINKTGVLRAASINSILYDSEFLIHDYTLLLR